MDSFHKLAADIKVKLKVWKAHFSKVLIIKQNDLGANNTINNETVFYGKNIKFERAILSGTSFVSLKHAHLITDDSPAAKFNNFPHYIKDSSPPCQNLTP